MKKQLFIMLFMAAPSLLFAQLKVTSSGNVYVQRDSITGQSTLSIGSIPGMTGRYYDTWRMGIRANTYNTATCIIRPIPVQFPEVLQGTSEA